MAELPSSGEGPAACRNVGSPRPIYTQSVEDARSRMRAEFVGREPEPIAQVTDISIGDTDRRFRCRAYRPNPSRRGPSCSSSMAADGC